MDTDNVGIVALAAYQEAEVNPKDHDIGEIVQSIRRFGLVERPVVDVRTGRLVAGHGRVEALRMMQADGEPPPDGIREEAGDWQIPTTLWASQDDVEAGGYLVASNRTTEKGGWDESALTDLLADLASSDALDGTGYDADDVDDLVSLQAMADLPPIDLPREPAGQRGSGGTMALDIFTLTMSADELKEVIRLVDALEGGTAFRDLALKVQPA